MYDTLLCSVANHNCAEVTAALVTTTGATTFGWHKRAIMIATIIKIAKEEIVKRNEGGDMGYDSACLTHQYDCHSQDDTFQLSLKLVLNNILQTRKE